jgi:ribosome-binding factor A
MNQHLRSDRVNELIHRSISKIIESELDDQRIRNVTVTGVEVTRDFKHAQIYISVLGDEQETATSLKALNKAAGYIRMRLGSEIILRCVPELQFRYDSSLTEGMRMDKLIEEINQKT